jgi:uncharacterized protein DUF3551
MVRAMRWTVLAIAAIGMASANAPAVAEGAAYCIKGCDYGGARGDCSFATYQQCLATASGRDAWCAENPDYRAKDYKAAVSLGDRSRQSRRRL